MSTAGDKAANGAAGGAAGSGTAGSGADSELLDRMERALARIEAGVDRPDPVAADVASRLDGMIRRVRDGLEG